MLADLDENQDGDIIVRDLGDHEPDETEQSSTQPPPPPDGTQYISDVDRNTGVRLGIFCPNLINIIF